MEDSLEMKPDSDGLCLIAEEKEMELPELKSPNPQLSKIRQVYFIVIYGSQFLTDFCIYCRFRNYCELL